MPLKPRRRIARRRAIELIDDDMPAPGAHSAVVPFLLGGIVAVGSLLAIFYIDSLDRDRASLTMLPPSPTQTIGRPDRNG